MQRTVRLDLDLVETLDSIVDELRELHRGRPASRESVAREALHSALKNADVRRDLGLR